jgi:hypothetical protein
MVSRLLVIRSSKSHVRANASHAPHQKHSGSGAANFEFALEDKNHTGRISLRHLQFARQIKLLIEHFPCEVWCMLTIEGQ